MLNKRKIINDPVYGFIDIPSEFIHDIIGHPNVQRLRRIQQLGLTNFVYPGANHTRFQHAIGAMHLMSLAINVIRSKGHNITEEEAEASRLAILLHDIGHGPYSHALEFSIVQGVKHEDISLFFMKKLNNEFQGKLDMAIKIFQNKYPKKFLHELVTSQLDMDRLDYLRRDSFYTGVTEGIIGSDRIIKMLNVVDDQLVIDSKGIYSIEKFLIARRLMYWQVYLHKTVLSIENLLVNALKRAKELAGKNINLFSTPALHYFLHQTLGKDDFEKNPEVLQNFARLDDTDIICALKEWQEHDDIVLSYLSKAFINRKLYKIELQNQPFGKAYLLEKEKAVLKDLPIDAGDVKYFVFTNEIATHTYSSNDENIRILFKNNELVDIAEASDMLNISVLDKTIKKYFLCYPKNS
ncbi:MAG: HD domain-containing protein [Bacteroidota bacterium]